MPLVLFLALNNIRKQSRHFVDFPLKIDRSLLALIDIICQPSACRILIKDIDQSFDMFYRYQYSLQVLFKRQK